MKEQNDSPSKSLEGVGVFAGVRPDNLADKMDPKNGKDKNPNLPEDTENKSAQVEESGKPDSTKNDKSQAEVKETNLENSDDQKESPLNTNIYGDKPEAF